MMSITNILVVIDPTQEHQPAFNRAMQTAENTGAALHFYMCVYKQSENGNEVSDLIKQEVINEAHQRLDCFTQCAEEEEIKASKEVEWDENWPSAVVATASRHGIDLVIKSSFSHSKAKRLLNRTSDWVILRTSPCPVLLVKREAAWENKGILAAVDIETSDPEHERLNNSIISFGMQMAGGHQAAVHLVNAYQDSLKYPDRANLLKKSGIPNQNIYIDNGSPSDVIIDRATALGVDLVVIGTVARHGVKGTLIGNTAEKVLDKLPCDVLTLN
jgi:universal stress protein E